MSGSRPGVGDLAPEFVLRGQHGREVALSSLRGRPVVLYFYPKDGTRGCTAQACSFRDDMAEFDALGATVLGVSSDSVDAHAAFARRSGITFQLLADGNGEVRERYGVPRTLGFMPGRTTYVIDEHGIVRHIYTSQLQPRRHVQEARDALARIREQASASD